MRAANIYARVKTRDGIERKRNAIAWVPSHGDLGLIDRKGLRQAGTRRAESQISYGGGIRGRHNDYSIVNGMDRAEGSGASGRSGETPRGVESKAGWEGAEGEAGGEGGEGRGGRNRVKRAREGRRGRLGRQDIMAPLRVIDRERSGFRKHIKRHPEINRRTKTFANP